jgi:hypothetical protein
MLQRSGVRQEALIKIRALFAAEEIDFNDKQAALKSLSETCLPTRLTEIYLEELKNGRKV